MAVLEPAQEMASELTMHVTNSMYACGRDQCINVNKARLSMSLTRLTASKGIRVGLRVCECVAGGKAPLLFGQKVRVRVVDEQASL